MYGLVNQGISKMVIDNFGVEKWESICREAGTVDVFVAMDPYPDEVTIRLVGAAGKVLEISPSEVLKAFGQWWIGFASVEYEHLFSMAGSSFLEFIENLNIIHTRVGYLMPKLTPPSFKVTDRTDESVIFCYYSTRDGLYPMILGMIEGIAGYFETSMEVLHTSGAEEGLDHDRFLIRLFEN